ncbi:MAG: glycosyltransferase family 2 protein [Candidatus Daviesbacteria bacterium]|nr:MAG: glycosyltransferase family 2 protein [Candidatus Daviesbacteria bacterium]
MHLSVIIPVYNEEKTVEALLKKVLSLKNIFEVIVVNDGSEDQTKGQLDKIKNPKLKVFHHPVNQGKGAAVRDGIKKAKGDFLIIQDADLEYDPHQFGKLMDQATMNLVVYGSRILGHNRHSYIRTYLGNVLVTNFYNLLYFKHLTDTYTCYKLIPTKIAQKLKLASNGFEIEAEITAKLTKMGVRIIEVPIKFKPRSYEQGKKIKAKDALLGLWTYLKIKWM